MVDTVRSLENHINSLPKKGLAYTLYYSQPKISLTQPHKVTRDNKKERFTASDDFEATRIMCEFLGSGMLELDTGTYVREGIRLVVDHPYRVVRDFFPSRAGLK